MTEKMNDDLFSLVDSIDAFGDGVTLVYHGDTKVNYLESSEAESGYTEALSDLGFKAQRVEIETDDWREAEAWGSDVPQDSLSGLIESAKAAKFGVTISSYDD